MVSTLVAEPIAKVKIDPPIWKEGQVGIDWVALRLSPIFYGIGVPRAETKQGLVLIPGFLSSDVISMGDLFFWLMRIGYIPFMSKIGTNAKCFDQLSIALEYTVNKAVEQTGKRVWLMGHSLGGIIARSAASRWPDKVSGVINLGTPIRSVVGHTLMMRIADFVRDDIHRRQPLGEENPNCFTQQCICPAVSAFNSGVICEAVHRAAVYTKNDGVVNWQDCLEDNPDLNYRAVSLCHNSLVCSPSSFRVIAYIMHTWQVEDCLSA